jgi:hypothetical protein
LRSFGFRDCRFAEVVAFFFLEKVADLANGFPDLVAGSGSGLSE